MYVLNDTNRHLFDEFVKQHRVWATWSPHKLSGLRTKIPRIVYDHHIKWGKMNGRTDDERLFDLGYYDRLTERGVPLSWIIEQTGLPDPIISVKIVEEEEEDI